MEEETRREILLTHFWEFRFTGFVIKKQVREEISRKMIGVFDQKVVLKCGNKQFFDCIRQNLSKIGYLSQF